MRETVPGCARPGWWHVAHGPGMLEPGAQPNLLVQAPAQSLRIALIQVRRCCAYLPEHRACHAGDCQGLLPLTTKTVIALKKRPVAARCSRSRIHAAASTGETTRSAARCKPKSSLASAQSVKTGVVGWIVTSTNPHCWASPES